MTQNKTQPNKGSRGGFLNSIDNETRRRDAKQVAKIMKAVGTAHACGVQALLAMARITTSTRAAGKQLYARGFFTARTNLVLYTMSGFGEYDALIEEAGQTQDRQVLFVRPTGSQILTLMCCKN